MLKKTQKDNVPIHNVPIHNKPIHNVPINYVLIHNILKRFQNRKWNNRRCMKAVLTAHSGSVGRYRIKESWLCGMQGIDVKRGFPSPGNGGLSVSYDFFYIFVNLSVWMLLLQPVEPGWESQGASGAFKYPVAVVHLLLLAAFALPSLTLYSMNRPM